MEQFPSRRPIIEVHTILIKNATVITMDGQRRILRDAVIGIKGNRIDFVGTAAGLSGDAGSEMSVSGRATGLTVSTP
jgi:cytosine/adenosine deaminase-related metal-dependent hydrolase